MVSKYSILTKTTMPHFSETKQRNTPDLIYTLTPYLIKTIT